MTEKKSYKDTLNMPQTTLGMRSDSSKEQEIQNFWNENDVYSKVLNSKDPNNRFLLHDGPPYLSSNKIHIGTALNKILKDITVKYKWQRGYWAPFFLGYDGHGLPIENAVSKTMEGGHKSVSPFELRQLCRSFALTNLSGQESCFKQLGVVSDWKNRYCTIDSSFEAEQVRVFWDLYKKGHLYKALKPVYWCVSCHTALADAEVEHKEKTSNAVHVFFKLKNSDAKFVIWTTTPWSLPANKALAFNPELTYVTLDTNFGKLIVAKDLMSTLPGVQNKTILEEKLGSEYEGVEAKHPFYDRYVPCVMADYVLATMGTGIVHIAPGFGHDDYLVGLKNNLEVYCPLDVDGKYDNTVGPDLAGRFYGSKGTFTEIHRMLITNNSDLHVDSFNHKVGHCWRCDNAVIYRATPQWFISLNPIKDKVVEEIQKVNWLPERGEKRFSTMAVNRRDWCISRQRSWGVPIPMFYCKECNEPYLTEDLANKIASDFEEYSSDIWFDNYELKNETCKCGSTSFIQEKDVMDVWFDSGITHTAAVLKPNKYGDLPVDLYLEGSDQHRGWFQSSMLTSVLLYDKAPYKNVITHGFVLDDQGRKMSKSQKNIVEPEAVISQYGADVLRLWVSSVDYGNDVKIGKESLATCAEAYRKIRNTIRFLVSNLYDFDPELHMYDSDNMHMFDKVILSKLQNLIQELTVAMDSYSYHEFNQLLHNFCSVDLSSHYFDGSKDMLYTVAPDDNQRRSCQTALYILLKTLTALIIPVLPHLAEEVHQNTPEKCKAKVLSVLEFDWPEIDLKYYNDLYDKEYEKALELKEAVNISLEKLKKEKVISNNLEVIVRTGRPPRFDLKRLLGVSAFEQDISPYIGPRLSYGEVDYTGYYIIRSTDQKCARCWKYLAKDSDICKDCQKVLESLNEEKS